jgi:hypothetical protein
VSRRKLPEPPLDGPNWLSFDNAYQQGKSIGALQRDLENERLHSKRRDRVGGKEIETLLDGEYWRNHEIIVLRGDRLKAQSRANLMFDDNAEFFVWRPDLWPTAEPTSPPSERSTDDKPLGKRKGSRTRDWIKEVAAEEWPDGYENVENRDLVKKVGDKTNAKRDMILRALDRRKD